MTFHEDSRIPSIMVYISPVFKNDSVLLNILSGVEEESIPYETVSGAEDNAVTLSYTGAENSVLEVGIGADSKGNVAVHFRKLPEEKPLFLVNYHSEPEKVRSICSNAARLVKGTPFILE